MLELYDTMQRSKRSFEGKDPISVYTCGPTVYLDPHIGNWRTFIFYDTLVRTLQLAGHDVRHVINITDVGHLVSDGDTGEDKLTKTAAAQRKTAWEIADHYTQIFLEGMQQLNMLKPFKLPKATDHIKQQIDMVKTLEEKGYTYKIDDGIYFDTSKLKDYGKLAGGKLSADEDFARINKNDQKKNPEDFALWKFSPSNEQRDMEWESPWGIGFPGWHLECSVMAKAYLGKSIDIHAGGVDHIPVHHTNEIAQSEAANDAEFAHYWMHAEFMKVDGAKMSKSKDNFYTLEDIQKKGFNAMDFRLLVLQGHYRTETNFTWENLEAAANRRRSLLQLAERRWQPIERGELNLTQHVTELQQALFDDLNTPKALSALNQLLQEAEAGVPKASVQTFVESIQLADKALGLNLIELTPNISAEHIELISQRKEARAQKKFDASDKLRDELLKSGIEVLDTTNGQFWQRSH